jgi:hypothetical protein
VDERDEGAFGGIGGLPGCGLGALPKLERTLDASSHGGRKSHLEL